jgi:hypothetical protein
LHHVFVFEFDRDRLIPRLHAAKRDADKHRKDHSKSKAIFFKHKLPFVIRADALGMSRDKELRDRAAAVAASEAIVASRNFLRCISSSRN